MENNDMEILNNQYQDTPPVNNTPVAVNPMSHYGHKDLPTGLATQMNLGRLGIILSNYSIVGVLLLFSSFLFFLGYALFYMMLLFISIATLGLIYILAPNFANLWGAAESMEGLINFIGGATGVIGVIVLFSTIASMILLWVDKNNRSIPRIIFAGVMCAIALVFVIGAIAG